MQSHESKQLLAEQPRAAPVDAASASSAASIESRAASQFNLQTSFDALVKAYLEQGSLLAAAYMLIRGRDRGWELVRSLRDLHPRDQRAVRKWQAALQAE